MNLKSAFGLAAVLAMSLWSPIAAHARRPMPLMVWTASDQSSLVVINRARERVAQLYVRPVGGGGLPVDLLGADYLRRHQSISVGPLEPGAYLVMVVSESGKSQVSLLVLEAGQSYSVEVGAFE